MSEADKSFREGMKCHVEAGGKAGFGGKSRYTSKQKVRKMSRRVGIGVVATLLAAGIGIGSISVIGHVNEKSGISITQMEKSGKDLSSLGLKEDTIQSMQKYDDFFENVDLNNLDMTDNGVIDVISEFEKLNFNVVKDKIADKTGVERSNVKLDYKFEKGDGQYHTTIVVNGGKSNEVVYTSADSSIFGIGRKNYIPKEISDLILQLRDYDGLVQDLKDDKISKANAIKELSKKYKKITEFATSKLEIDQRGNISVENFNMKNDAIDREDYQK